MSMNYINNNGFFKALKMKNAWKGQWALTILGDNQEVYSFGPFNSKRHAESKEVEIRSELPFKVKGAMVSIVLPWED